MLDDGRPVPLGTAKQQALLGVLLLHANEVVPRERLIDELWGDQPPATAVKAVQVYVSQLRKRLPRNGRGLATHANGYVLELQPDELDAIRFERAVAEARERAASGKTGEASRLFRQALAQWRGRALAGLSFESYASADVERLEEQRLAALADRIECELVLGRHELVIGDLEQLVAEHPLKEQLHGQRMLALYRSGRQADALRAYREARETLVEQYGIEPSAPLQRLEHAILLQDASLEAPSGTVQIRDPAAAPPPAPANVPGKRRRRPLVLGAVIAALAAVGAALLLEGFGAGEPVLARIEPNSVGVIDPTNGRIISQIPVGAGPASIVVGHGAVWVANEQDQTVSRIALGTSNDQPIVTRGHPSALALSGDAVWVAAATEQSVLKIDPRYRTAGTPVMVARTTPGESRTIGIAADDSVWVADPPGHIVRLDRAGRAVGKVALVNGVTGAVAVGPGRLWVGGFGALSAVDPATGQMIESIRIGGNPVAVVASRDSVWVALGGFERSAERIDPKSGVVRMTIPLERTPAAIVVGGGSVWIADATGASVLKLDPEQGEVVQRIRVGSSPTALAFAEGRLWVAVR